MKHSEFWQAVETVHGAGLGRSLARDLVLSAIGATAEEALAQGVSPQLVWQALCDETGASPEQRWVYRGVPKARG